MWIIILIVFLVIIIIGVVAATQDEQKTQERGEEMKQALVSIPDFTPSTKIVGVKNLYTFAIDNERQKVLFMLGTTPKQFGFEDIISVELIEDNQIISQKSTGRTIGGALIGGVVAGGVGAIVGGLSGSSKQENLHSSVKVKILLRNSSVPSIEIPCFDVSTMTLDGKPVKDIDVTYRQGKAQATRITDILTVIIDAVDRAIEAQKASAPSNNGSVAEEIAKLAVLKEKGILTEEEFAAQKAKLLGGEQAVNTPAPLKIELPQGNPLDDELRNLIVSGKKVEAYKLYKDSTGVDLTKAVEYVNSLI